MLLFWFNGWRRHLRLSNIDRWWLFYVKSAWNYMLHSYQSNLRTKSILFSWRELHEDCNLRKTMWNWFQEDNQVIPLILILKSRSNTNAVGDFSFGFGYFALELELWPNNPSWFRISVLQGLHLNVILPITILSTGSPFSHLYFLKTDWEFDMINNGMVKYIVFLKS